MQTPPGAVVMGGHVNGLGVVRALAARGVPTAVVRTRSFDIAHRSRWIQDHDQCLEIDRKPEQLVELLEHRAPDWPGWALFPTNDESLAVLSRYRERLSSRYRVLAPGWEVAQSFLDKHRMLEAASSVGIPLPRCYGPAESAESNPAIRFPVVVKPTGGSELATHFGAKLLRADDASELRSCVAQVTGAGIACEVFDLVPGGDDQIYTQSVYMAENGKPVAGLTTRKLRQSPPFFGVARVAELAAPNPELHEATVELLRKVGFRGYAVAEFKRDARDGSLRFFEMNGRSVMYNALLRCGGFDLAALTWTDHFEGGPAHFEATGWNGVWIHLHADLFYSALGRRQDPVPLSAFAAPYQRPKVFAVWSAADPAPFVRQWAGTAAEGATHLVRGTFRKRLADRSRPVAPDRG
jgi:predicted ATP-grasp superfamily ATP-dependent carboligase